eukprot:gnl/TRDRNA2_/TRDRNA2_134466_c0_seq1.p1 gnl/TRDRNA2_/TRDRNA2_134466_c0~~gnl/TRDRNA2_/TRDRNA2_134466_c0_seq1.p1  ORF type:complete len:903 (+),score=155.47 gnl/TRDRNA2_/TRDRNA2_134466_c0_seq1:96-2804(+)
MSAEEEDAEGRTPVPKPVRTMGIVTCGKEENYGQYMLAYIVEVDLVLVLDRIDLDCGKVLGVLQFKDVAITNEVNFPWIGIPAGSHVRHQKMRNRKVKLRDEGWLMVKHPVHGALLSAYSSLDTRKHFRLGHFRKLPVVKTIDVGPLSDEASATVSAKQKESTQIVESQQEQNGTRVHAHLDDDDDARMKPMTNGASHSSNKADAKLVAKLEETKRIAEYLEKKSQQEEPKSVDYYFTTKAPKEEKTAGKAPALPTSKPAASWREPFAEHMKKCPCQHWKVMHTHVFVREQASLTSNRCDVVRKDNIICVGRIVDTDKSSSMDDDWVRIAMDSRIWKSTGDPTVKELFSPGNSDTGGFILKWHSQSGELIRLVENSNVLPAQPPLVSMETFAPSGAVDAANENLPPMPEISKLEHWVIVKAVKDVGVVAGKTAPGIDAPRIGIVASAEVKALVEFPMSVGDVILVGSGNQGRSPQKDGPRSWLQLPRGAMVLRRTGNMVHGYRLQRAGHVLVQDDRDVFVNQVLPETPGALLRIVAGYGEPWVVEHDQVVVRRGPSTSDLALGITVRGDIVGVLKTEGNWVQLMVDQDVRVRCSDKASEDQKSSICHLNVIPELKVDILQSKSCARGAQIPQKSAAKGRLSRGAVRHEAWMMVRHPKLGALLSPAVQRKGLQGCLVSEKRFQYYRDVIDICRRRIFEENLEGLWDGERDKLPTTASLEEKLFDCRASVLHVSVENKFTGGAIIKSIRAKCKGTSSSATTFITSGRVTGAGLHDGFTTVGYIDCCAAEPGTHTGSVIWDHIAKMNFVCITCHSILLQSTVDFWQSKGMRRVHPESEHAREEFKQAIHVHTMGKVVLELKDVVAALPTSHLPLFVWVPNGLIGQDAGSSGDEEGYIFTPEDRET